MSKFNHKIILFIEPASESTACDKPSEIGTLFINRFSIDERMNHEILKIYILERQFLPRMVTGWSLHEFGLDLDYLL